MMKNFLILFGVLVVLFFSCTTKPPITSDRIAVAPIKRDASITKDISLVEAERQQQIYVNSDSISYFHEDYLRHSNFIYKPNIKTVLFHREGWEMSNPIIELGKNERLRFSFDDLDGDLKNYQYTIVHCNSDWEASDLNVADYIDGFNTDYITEYKTSINTLQSYTYYSLIFPGNNVRPKISGNYILKVFIDTPENVVITRRFMVFEPRVSIEGRVRQATVIEDKNYRQEIVFSILHPSYRISNPFSNLKVVLQQNQRTDNMITTLKPSLIRNNEIIYDYEFGNVFDGDQEYRFFDLKNLKLLSEGIDNIQLRRGAYYVFLTPDERRSFRRYTNLHDINGRRVIKSEEARDSDIESEYAHVHFFLTYPAPFIHGHVYLLGELTSWNFSEESKMIYNYKTKTYEKSLFLKQGYYNYMYAFLENGKSVADVSYIEGTHSQTENDYTIYVYYKEPNDFYDRLIGVKFLNSRN